MTKLATLAITVLLGLLLGPLGALPAQAGTTASFTLAAQSYAGSRERQVKVYVPDGLSGPAPMVMALHGCQQTNDDVLRDWGLVAAAERHKFILVAPFITSYDGLRNTNCWGFWLDQHRHQGRGEPEDLHRIGLAVEARYAVDPKRRYVTGLSSGGAMAVVLSVTHNEYFAAAASAAGLPYGEDAASVSFSGCPGSATFHGTSRVLADMRAERNDGYAIPLMVLQNNRDCTVLQAAGRALRDAQLLLNGDAAHDTATEARALQKDCAPSFGATYGCQQVVYTVDAQPASRSLVETVFYDGPTATPDTSDTDHGHYWIGGQDGGDGRWSLRNGPSFPDITWDFFSRHPAGPATPAVNVPVITLLGPDPLRLVRGQAFTDPGATAQDVEDGVLPVLADCSSVDINRVGSYSCRYSATDRAGHTSVRSRGVQVADAAPPAPVCPSMTAAPGTHVAAGRAVAGGAFSLRAISTGDRKDIGAVWNYYLTRVTLHQGSGGLWYAARPAACAPR